MARVPPQAPLDKLGFPRAFVFQMRLKLFIADQLENKTKKEYRDAQIVRPQQLLLYRVNQGVKTRTINDD